MISSITNEKMLGDDRIYKKILEDDRIYEKTLENNILQ